MAISAISSISAGGVRPFLAPIGATDPRGNAAPIPSVARIPSLAAREGEREDTAAAGPDETSKVATTAGARQTKAPTLDPRSAASVVALAGTDAGARAARPASAAGQALAGGADARDPLGADRRREAQDRLTELMGQRGEIERSQAEAKNERSAEIVNVLAQLKSRDSEVRAHEAAHMAAGGRYITGGASYTYERGPDGGEYAVGGEVGIDTSPVPGNPEETAQKMRTIRAAALAPSDPSAADLSVAASAAETEAAAMAEIAQARIDEAARASAPRQPLNMLA